MPERMTPKYDETTSTTSSSPIVTETSSTSQVYMHGGKKGYLKRRKKMPKLTGIYVGVAVAIAVPLVTFLVISIRQRHFCFKPRSPLKNKMDEFSASRNTSHTDLWETTNIADANHYEDISTDRVSNQYQNLECSNSEAVEVAKSGNGNQRSSNNFKTLGESIRKHKRSEQSKDNRKKDVFQLTGHTEHTARELDFFTIQYPRNPGISDGDYMTFEDPSVEAESVTYDTLTATDIQSPNDPSKATHTVYNSEIMDKENLPESCHYINNTVIKDITNNYQNVDTDGCTTNSCTQQERTSMYEEIVMHSENVVRN